MKNLLFAVLLVLSFAVPSIAQTYSTGLVKPLGWEEGVEFLSDGHRVVLPAHFDWREKLGKFPAILNQGQCGSCWAFSRVATLSWQYLINGGEAVTPAPQELVSCDNQSMGCGGGYWSNYEVSPGISDEQEFPYVARNVRCKSGLSHTHQIAKWVFVGSKGRSPSVDEIKQAIFQYGPVGATISANGSFMNYHGGLFGNGRCSSQTNHMIVLAGWDDATRSWVLQNSWGEKWGEKGFAEIKWGSNCVGETSAVAILNL